LLPGQNDKFSPVVPLVPRHFSYCPCGVSTMSVYQKWHPACKKSLASISNRGDFWDHSTIKSFISHTVVDCWVESEAQAVTG